MIPNFANHSPYLGSALSDPLVIKVASIPANMARNVGYRISCEDPDLRKDIADALETSGAIDTLRLAQIAADIKGSQAIYQDEDRYSLKGSGQPVAMILDRNSIGDLAILGGSPSSTVSRFWAVAQEYYNVMGRLKRRLSTVVIYSEVGLKRTLADHDTPQDYLDEITGQLYQSLGNTGVLVIDEGNKASVLNLDLGGIDKAVLPWQRQLLAASGGLTEDQLWGGSDRPVGLSGADEQSRRAIASMVDAITDSWEPFINYAAKHIAHGLGVDWTGIRVTFNRYDNPSLEESLRAQKLAAEADKIAIEADILTRDEVRASRHGGDGLGVDISLAAES